MDAAGDGGLGACVAEVPDQVWADAYRLTEVQGAYVRLDWVPTGEKSDEAPPVVLADHRGASTLLAAHCDWKTAVRLKPQTRYGAKHINVLEARALLYLTRFLVRSGARDCRVIVFSDSQVCVGAFGKGRSSARRLNYPLRCVSGLALRFGLTLEVVWIPTWANPADAPSRGRSLKEWRASLPEWLPKWPGLGNLPLTIAPDQRDGWERLLGPGSLEKGPSKQTGQWPSAPAKIRPSPRLERFIDEQRRRALGETGNVKPHPGPREGRIPGPVWDREDRSTSGRARPGATMQRSARTSLRDHHHPTAPPAAGKGRLAADGRVSRSAATAPSAPVGPAARLP